MCVLSTNVSWSEWKKRQIAQCFSDECGLCETTTLSSLTAAGLHDIKSTVFAAETEKGIEKSYKDSYGIYHFNVYIKDESMEAGLGLIFLCGVTMGKRETQSCSISVGSPLA